ncbi:MAG: T9SS type A sorting domain-containing protein [Chitinophagales bacterium]|nr:T9SS type A sorting domain-containing protein [Chitinophagales bacterium]
MKKIVFAILAFVLYGSALAQGNSSVFGIIRQNYYSTVTDPFDSSITWQQLDSCTIRLGYSNPSNGQVFPVGNTQYARSINLTGAALDPYNNTYIFQSGTNICSFDMSSGNLINQVPLTNSMGNSYFDNFRFNHSDSSIYGLSRRNYFDPVSGTTKAGVFLAKANSQTGTITEISPSAIAGGYAILGSAIDPYQMIYYFSGGNNLMGVDMYTGAVYSNPTLSFNDGFSLGNFTYSCVDTAIYGLVRQNYFSYIYDPFNPLDSIQVLDSATLKLGRVNPITGVVTNISAYSFGTGGYSINGGAAIDPVNRIYYFSSGNAVVGVSMLTGQIVSAPTYAISGGGDYFDLMRNSENCYAATRIRQNPQTTAANNIRFESELNVFPNPSAGRFTVTNPFDNGTLTVYDVLGHEVLKEKVSDKQMHINIEKAGIYYLHFSNNNTTIRKAITVQ